MVTTYCFLITITVHIHKYVYMYVCIIHNSCFYVLVYQGYGKQTSRQHKRRRIDKSGINGITYYCMHVNTNDIRSHGLN